MHPGSCGGCTSGEGAGGRVRPQLPHNTLHYNTTAQLLHHNTTPQDYKPHNHHHNTPHNTQSNHTTTQHKYPGGEEGEYVESESEGVGKWMEGAEPSSLLQLNQGGSLKLL